MDDLVGNTIYIILSIREGIYYVCFLPFDI